MEELVLNALIENNNKYCVYGLRTDDRVFNVGDELGCSRDLYWENTEETYLPGTCATGFGYLWYDEDDIDEVRKALARQQDYDGAHMYLIAGEGEGYGNDPQEVIISHAVVVAVIK